MALVDPAMIGSDEHRGLAQQLQFFESGNDFADQPIRNLDGGNLPRHGEEIVVYADRLQLELIAHGQSAGKPA